MEDFGYKSEDQENYTKNLTKRALFLSFIFFSVFCFIYIAVNAYNYFQNNKEIRTIEPKVVKIKTYPKELNGLQDESQIKIDNSIYEDIFGTKKKKKKKIKIKKIIEPAIPPKKITTTPGKNKKKTVIKKKAVYKKPTNKTTRSGRKMSRVQLAAMTTKDSAMRFLKITKSRYSKIFSGLDGYIQEVDLGKRGVFFRVQVGDFYDQVRAESFCKKYIAATQKSKSDCIVID